MFFSEPKNFHDSIKPLVYFNCFAGMSTFWQPNQSNTEYVLMNIYIVILTLFNWSAMYMTLNFIMAPDVSDFTTPMGLMMYKALFCTNSLTVVISPLLVWLRRKGMKDCLRQMLILNDTFPTVLDPRNEYKKQYIRLSCQIIAIVSVIFLVSVFDVVSNMRMLLQWDFRMLFILTSVTHTLHYPLLVMLLLDLNFCTLIGYLGKKFRDLNDSLLGLVKKSSVSYSGDRPFIISQNGIRITCRNQLNSTETDNSTNDIHDSLRKVRKAHFELCKLSRKLNLAFGVQNLLSMGLCFVMVTGLLYAICSVFATEISISEAFVMMNGSALWAAIYVFKIWVVNHSCWSVSNEAERTGELIYSFLNSRVDEEEHKEIQEFVVQILQNPVRFDACGFFTLDYTFVQGVIGSVTTYLVILIQMIGLSESSTSDTTRPLVYNVTEILPINKMSL